MTRIPSYDDLTPSIPDVETSGTVAQLQIFLEGGVRLRPPYDSGGLRETASIAAPVSLYACLSAREAEPGLLLSIARDFSPRVMRVAETAVLLDVSGLGRLIGEPPAIAAELARALADAGVDAAVAIAPTGTSARLLAARREAAPAIAADAAASIAPLPIADLEPLETLPPAIAVRDRARPYETLERWGIATLGDLAALPPAELSTRLGRRGVALQRLARGLDPGPFAPDAETPRFIQRLDLEWPIDALEPLSFILARLLDPLSSALERADRGAAALRLDLGLTDRSTHARVLQLPAPMRDARVLRTLLLLDLESHPPHAAIDVVTIEVDPAPARITQFSLLERALPSPETLSTLLARLSALVGDTRCGAAVLLDTHRPGAFEMERFHPGADDACLAEAASRRRRAAGAGAAGAHAFVVRRRRIPLAIRVRVEQGRPVHVAVVRRGMPGGTVTQAAGPWRTSGGWWTQTGAGGAGGAEGAEGAGAEGAGGAQGAGGAGGAWNRDEWDVALSDGAVCRIFQDRVSHRWFLDGIYD